MFIASIHAASLALLLGGPPASPLSPSVEPAGAVAAAPAVLGFAPSVLDLGEMVAGRPKSATVTVTNLTGGTVTIAKVAGTCGCTTIAGAPESPIAAGGSFTLTITVDPGAKTGIDLRKSVIVAVEDAAAQTLVVKGHVKTVVRVTPDVLDASLVPVGASGVVTLESVDGGAFAITGAEPASLVRLPGGRSARHAVAIDWTRWSDLGSPAKLTLTTDKVDAESLVVMIKWAPLVAMFRLPAAPPDSPRQSLIEAEQDAVIHAIDDRLAASRRSGDFKVKLHRETGMLFVHGTDADLAEVRAVMSSSGIAESGR